MNVEHNERLTRLTPGTPCGHSLRHLLRHSLRHLLRHLLRQYWQPAALVDEVNKCHEYFGRI